MYIHLSNGCFRFFVNHKSWFEASFCKSLGATIEFPSEWHEDGLGSIHIAFFFFQVFIHFPWFRVYEDHYQCSGPTFGLIIKDNSFGMGFNPALWVYYGNSDGSTKNSKLKIIYGPWDWGYAKVSKDVGDKSSHDYKYTLNSGEVQHIVATIQEQYREWRRFWIPWKMSVKSIYVDFSDEIGEKTGSWKGGVFGCSYNMKKGESPYETLKRMEKEEKF